MRLHQRFLCLYRQPKEGVYSQVEFLETAREYFNNPIEVSLKSDNMIIKILALLDRRIGKRTLENIKATDLY